MKRIFLLAILWVWLGGALSAQKQRSLDAITKDVLSNLDKSSLQTGILLQQAPVWVNPFRFDGTAEHDSNAVNPGTFGRLYGQLRAAAVGQSVLPEPGIYLDELARLREHPSDTVPLGLLAMQFEYIAHDAFERGLLEWGSDQKVHQVAGQTQSPYRRDTTFVF